MPKKTGLRSETNTEETGEPRQASLGDHATEGDTSPLSGPQQAEDTVSVQTATESVPTEAQPRGATASVPHPSRAAGDSVARSQEQAGTVTDAGDSVANRLPFLPVRADGQPSGLHLPHPNKGTRDARSRVPREDPFADEVSRLSLTLGTLAPQGRYDRGRSPAAGPSRKDRHRSLSPHRAPRPEELSVREQELIKQALAEFARTQPMTAAPVSPAPTTVGYAQTASPVKAPASNTTQPRVPMYVGPSVASTVGGSFPAAAAANTQSAAAVSFLGSASTTGYPGYSQQPASNMVSQPGYPQTPAAPAAGYMGYSQGPATAVSNPVAPQPLQPSNVLPAHTGLGPSMSGPPAFGDGQSTVGDGYHGGYDTAEPRRRVNPPPWRLKYNGSNVDLSNFLGQLEAYADNAGWTDGDMGVVLLSSLEGVATQVLANLPPRCSSYAVISQKLRDMFAPTASLRAFEKEFQARLRREGESASDYSLALQGLGRKAYPNLIQADFQVKLVNQFIDGQPYYIKYALSAHEKHTLAEAVAAAISVESTMQSRQGPQPPSMLSRNKGAAVKQAFWDAMPPIGPDSFATPRASFGYGLLLSPARGPTVHAARKLCFLYARGPAAHCSAAQATDGIPPPTACGSSGVRSPVIRRSLGGV